MKIKWNDKYTTISIYSFLVICASIVFYLVVSEFSSFKINISEFTSVFQPFIIGFVMAYLLNFILKFIEEKIFKPLNNLSQKSKRLLSLIFTYITVILFIYVFLNFVFPQLANSVIGLINNIPFYANNISRMLNESIKDLSISKEGLDFILEKWNEFLGTVTDFATNLLPMLGNFLKSLAASIWNILLGLVISIYLLIDKERFFALGKKMTLSIFSKKTSENIIDLLNRTNSIFGKFISGKILDSFIVGILTFFILKIFNMPYAILVSFIIGLTNIVPFFGPFIGAIPSFFIILFVSPVKSLWFLLIILFIQQVDGNIIGPKILGDSLGISAFWILFALLIASKFFGFIGMIIGVPLFALIYSVIKDYVEKNLEKKGLPTDTDDYL